MYFPDTDHASTGEEPHHAAYSEALGAAALWQPRLKHWHYSHLVTIVQVFKFDIKSDFRGTVGMGYGRNCQATGTGDGNGKVPPVPGDDSII